MRSIERKLDNILELQQATLNLLFDISAQLTAGSDEKAIKQAIARLRTSSDQLKASVEANQPRPK
jgi:hypothetical protein